MCDAFLQFQPRGLQIFLLRKISIAFALLAAGLASQLPEFAQQYRQRLGGAIDELHRFIRDFDRDAKSNGLTRAQGIEKLRRNKEPLASQRGRRIRETETRLTRLKNQQDNFKDAGSFNRMAIMAKDFDPFIAQRAYKDFEPAIPVSLEGIVTAIAGFLAGFGIWKFLAWPMNAARRRRRNRMSVTS